MSTVVAPLAPSIDREPVVTNEPDLENGDRMDRAEFHRRFELLPDIKKAELIEGIVYMGSPARVRHGRPQKDGVLWLGTYELATPGVECLDNVTVFLDDENEPMPDVLLRLDERLGGRSRLTDDGYLEGAPELILEVAASTVSKDLHQKKRAYERVGVREYLVWRTKDRALDWFRLDEAGRYAAIAPDARGIIESATFPGLRLAVADLLAGRLRETLDELARGTASDAHRAFAAGLAGAPPLL